MAISQPLVDAAARPALGSANRTACYYSKTSYGPRRADRRRLAGFPLALGELPCLAIESLRIEAGERVFLFGPSGSGKSTLLALLAGVLTAQEGSVRVLGTELSSLRRTRPVSRRAHWLHLPAVQSGPVSVGDPQRPPALPLLGQARATGNRGSWHARRRRAAFAGRHGARAGPSQAQGDGPVGRPAAARGGGARAYRFA